RLARADLTPTETRARFGWLDERQVVVHAGNMGLKQGLAQVIDAAQLAARRGEPVRFVLVGGGSQAATLKAAAAGSPNLEVLPLQADGTYASLLAAADVLLLSERRTQLEMSLPSKLTSYLSAGRPIVAAVAPGGATAQEVERSGAGIVAPAGDSEQLLAALRRVREGAGLAERLSQAGPSYAAAHLGRTPSLMRASAFVSAITARSADLGGSAVEASR
ncbi:MAG: glycosyltransferase, partial [Gemmatimonadales bacterium]